MTEPESDGTIIITYREDAIYQAHERKVVLPVIKKKLSDEERIRSKFEITTYFKISLPKTFEKYISILGLFNQA